jgi:hypothetical protein
MDPSVTRIIFRIALSEYNQVLLEESKAVRHIHDSDVPILGFSGFSCFSFCRIEWRRVSTRGDSFVLRSYSSLTKCSRVYCPRSVLRRLSTGIHTNNPFLIVRRYRSRSIYPSTPLVWTSTKQQKKNCGVLCSPTAQS